MAVFNLFSNNFLPLEQLFALPRNADPALLNDWPQRGLGAVLFVGVLFGIIMGWRLAGEKRWITAVLTFIFTAYLFIATPFSTILWENISILAAFQFPWRFLAPATLAAVMLIGAIVEVRNPKSEVRSPLTVYGSRLKIGIIAICAISVLHWGWLYPNHCDVPKDTTLAGMVNWELGTGTLGTTASRELLPVTVRQMPQEPDALLPWEARILAEDLPEGAQIMAAEYGALDATIEISAHVPFVVRYRAFDFPGWQVTVNGKPVPITPSDPHGLITFPVGNGRSTIHVTFSETPLRRTADTISLLSIILLAIICIYTSHSLGPNGAKSSSLFVARFGKSRQNDLPNRSTKWPAYSRSGELVILSLLLIAAKLWLVDTQRTPLHQSRLAGTGELTGVDMPASFVWGDPANPLQIRLLGYDEVETAVPANQPLTVTLYWQALTQLDQEYRVGLTLVDANGLRWSAVGLRDTRWVRNPEPTTTWPTDHYVLTSYFVDPLPGTPPGDYTLELSLFDQETFQPLTIYDATGQPVAPSTPLNNVILTIPQQRWQPEHIEMQNRLDAALNGLTLWGSDVDRIEAAPGDELLMTLFWSAEMRPVAGELAVVDEGGTAVFSQPITFNSSCEGVWRHQQLIRLPASFNDGRYRWQFSLPTGESVQWGELTMDAPARLFNQPDISHEVGVTFDGQAVLTGVNFDENAFKLGEPFGVEIIWQGSAEMSESYRVFVHLLAHDGAILAQSDTIPAAWTRPTTGWQPGEYITDSHQLSIPQELPPGAYQLRIGMYLPGGSRLLTSDGNDSVLIPIGGGNQ